MKIGFSIDGVLRNFLGRVEEVHKKYFSESEEDEIQVLDYDLDKWLKFPEEEVKQGEIEFDVNFNEKDFLVSEDQTKLEKKIDKVTVEDFLYNKCTLEIFGYADEEINSAVQTLNQLIIDNPKHEFYLISREIGLSVPSTFFFLSKTKCMIQNVNFVTDFKSCWDLVDVMVTDRPEIINSKPKNKICIKINKNYNDSYDSDFVFKTIKELDNDFIEEISNLLVK
jgi:hypothetical protein